MHGAGRAHAAGACWRRPLAAGAVGARCSAGSWCGCRACISSMLTLAFAQIAWAVSFQWVERDRRRQRPARRLAAGLGARPAHLLLDRARALGRRGRCCCGVRSTRPSATRCGPRGIRGPRRGAIGLDVDAAAAGGAGRRGRGRRGSAAAIFAYGKGGVFPTYISIPHSVEALLMVLLGGVQTVAGPIVGALAYTGLRRPARALHRPLAARCWARSIVLLVLAFPEGIAGGARRLWLRGPRGVSVLAVSRPAQILRRRAGGGRRLLRGRARARCWR